MQGPRGAAMLTAGAARGDHARNGGPTEVRKRNMTSWLLLQASDPEIPAGGGIGGIIFALIIGVVMIAALWKVFAKAGEPGWAAIVPIYNILTMLKIAGKPGWWFLLFLIPGVNAIISILVAISLAAKFGKGAGFGLGMAFLPVIFYPMLGFGSSTYNANG